MGVKLQNRKENKRYDVIGFCFTKKIKHDHTEMANYRNKAVCHDQGVGQSTVT